MNPNVQQVYSPNSNGNNYLINGKDVILIGAYQKPNFNQITMIFTENQQNQKNKKDSISTELGEEHISHDVLGHLGVAGLFLEMFSKLVDKDNPTIKLDFFTNTQKRVISTVNTHIFSEFNPVFALLSQNRIKEKISPMNVQTKAEPKQIQKTKAHKSMWLGNISQHPNYIPNKPSPSDSLLRKKK